MQSIDEYFTEVRGKITEVVVIDAEDIILERFGGNIGRIHGRIFFRDKSMLEFLEMIVINKEVKRPRYRFHWQDNKGELIIRWDNAKHHPEITGFPHHKHVKKENQVKPATPIGIIRVLETINKAIIGDWSK